MTSRIYNFSPSKIQSFHLGKMEKPSLRLSKDTLNGFSFSQRESKSSSCDWLVSRIKQVFEKFVAFLRCLFCCKSPEKKLESVSDQTQKTITMAASKAATKETPAKNQTIPIVTHPVRTNVSSDSFGNMPKDIRGLIREYLDYPDSLNLAKNYPDLGEKLYKDLLREIEKKDVVSLEELWSLVEKLKDVTALFSGPIDDSDALKVVFQHCKNLKELTFTRPYDEEILRKIALSLPASVPLLNFQNSEITNSELEVLTKNCPRIREIGLSGIQIKDDALKILAANCKQLRSLFLEFALITDEGLRMLTENCKELRAFILYGCNQITDAGLQAIAANCKQLEALTLTALCGHLDAGLEAILTNCKQLKLLRLIRFHTGDQERLLRILVTNCTQLQELDISDLSITDATLQTLLGICKKLQSFSLSASDISDTGLQLLAENCKGLKSLNLSNCHHITDEGLRKLAANCKQLRELDLSWCTGITDKGVQFILENCKDLEALDLGGCDQLTDVIFQAIAANCPKLRRLRLYMCNITDERLQSISENCKQLHVPILQILTPLRICDYRGLR